MSSLNTQSGPHPPQGAKTSPRGVHAEVKIKSGPHPPQGGVAPGPGPHPPPGRSPAAANPTAAGGAAAAAEATEPKPTREETVGIRLSIPKPEPFSVFLSSDDKGGIQIDSIDIDISDEDQRLFTTRVGADLPIVIKNPAESHVFPFGEEQLAQLLPHLAVGNTVEIRVHYLATNTSEFKVGIIGRKYHHRLGRFIEHLFHRG